MRKLFVIFLLLALCAAVLTGEKRIVGARVNNQLMLLRIDLANYAMDCSIDGVVWNAIPGTSGEFIINDNSLSLAKLAQIPTASILGNVSESTGNVSTLSASDLKTLIGNATTSAAGLMSGTDKTKLNSGVAASGANSDITSLAGLTTPLSVAQGGTGATTASGALASLGAIAAPATPAQGDILYYSGSVWSKLVAGTSGQYLQTQGAGANPVWATVSGSGSGDVTGPASSTNSNLAVFDGATGKIIKDSGKSISDFATSGANSNITSLTGLTTPLSVAQGGTGLSSLGTAGQVLTVNSGASAAEWATPSGGGMTNPMTTAGDIIVGGTSGTPARLAAGTSGHVLTAQGSAAAPVWAAVPSPSVSWSDITGKPDIPDNPSAASIDSGNYGLPLVVSGSLYWTANNSALESARLALVHAWNLDGLTDSVGSRTLTNTGAVSFSANGMYNKCASGFSATDYLAFGEGTLVDGAYSLCVRFYADSASVGSLFELPMPYGTLIVVPYESSTGFYLGHRVPEEPWVSDGGFYCASPSTGAWHTLIVSFASRTSCTVYLDGVQQTLTPNSIGGIAGARMIGGDYEGNYFRGKLDELYIFNRALTAAECVALYNSGTGSFITQGINPSYDFPVQTSGSLSGSEQLLYRDPADNKAYYKTFKAAGLVDSVASSETTVTTSYTADYDDYTIHRIKTTASTACALTVQDIPLGKALVIRVDNTAGGSITFNSSTIVSSETTGIRFLSFTNVTGTIELVQ